MDFATLAKDVMDIITPLLPFLAGAGTAAGTAVATKAGEDLYGKSKKLYTTVHEHFAKAHDGGKASKALQTLVEDPDNRDTVEIKLTRMLQDDPTFADELSQQLQAYYRQSILVGDDSEVYRISMKNNTEQSSEQTIKGGDRSRFTDINMNIGKDSSV